MTPTPKLLPCFDYDLKFDVNECGSAPCTYYGLLTDYHSPVEILVRWKARGFSGAHADNAAEDAEALAKEIVKRWNAYSTPAPVQAEAVDVRREPLDAMIFDFAYGEREVIKEGFPHLSPMQFVDMLCKHYKIEPSKEVNRIEFQYTEITP